MVLALLVLLVVVGGGGIWAALYVTSHHPHLPATPTATRPVTPPLSPYDQFVMKNGIQFGFDAQHSRFNPYESQLSPATVATLVQAWTATTGGAISSSPAVANGVVYVGSKDGKLYAFKADGCGQPTCSPLWTASTGAQIASNPAVANGVVYVGSRDHKLYAFKADGCGQPTCSPLWTATTGSYIDSSPAVANGVVGSRDHKLYAFRRK
jgi:outer membrane protein assembly factor BamB